MSVLIRPAGILPIELTFLPLCGRNDRRIAENSDANVIDPYGLDLPAS